MNSTTFNPLASALRVSFDQFFKKHVKYKNYYRSLPKEIVDEVVFSALDELKTLDPINYHLWWHRNHPRFKFKQFQLSIIHELMFVFLSALARGKILNETNEKKQNTDSKNRRRPAHTPSDDQPQA